MKDYKVKLKFKFKLGPVLVTDSDEESAKYGAAEVIQNVLTQEKLSKSLKPTQMDDINGERNWLEAFFVIQSLCWPDLPGKETLIDEVFESGGRFAVLDQIIDWTNKFEEKYKDEDWAEKDWIETIEHFITNKNILQ